MSSFISSKKCLICYSSFQKSEASENTEHFSTVFQTFCHLLQIDWIEPIQWNFEQEDIAFCKLCGSTVSKLKKLNNQIEIIQSQINSILHKTKKNFLISLSDTHVSKTSSGSELDQVDYFRDLVYKALIGPHVDPTEINCTSPIVDKSKVKVEPEAELETHNGIGFCLEHINESSEIEDNVNETDPLEIKPEISNSFNSDYVDEDNCSPQNDATGCPDSIFLDPDDVARAHASVGESDSRRKTDHEQSTNVNQTKPSTKKKHKCDICGKMFTTRSHLNTHTKIHTRDKPHICEFCGKSFSQPIHLRNHRRIHTGEKPFKCEICDKGFSTATILTNHKTVHTKELVHNCEVCHKKFPRPGALRVHSKIHAGDRKFKCGICGKTFLLHRGLNVHKRVHSDEKPYKCKICGRAFAYSDAVVKHLRTHTGEKPYKCEICGSAFAQSSSLVRHRRTHTGEK